MNESDLRHGAFGWNELMTTDTEGAKKFYGGLFGWEIEAVPMGGADYSVIKVNGDAVGGMTTLPQNCGAMGPCWGVYVTVDDVDATAGKVEELGGKVIHPPTDIPNVGRFCVIADPQGGTLAVISYLKE